MITKKRFEAQVSNNNSHGRSPFWVKPVHQSNSVSDEKAFAVFQSDVLIPEQFLATYQRTFRLDPEKVLMLAVLQDAVVCFQDNIAATCKRKQALHDEAEDATRRTPGSAADGNGGQNPFSRSRARPSGRSGIGGT